MQVEKLGKKNRWKRGAAWGGGILLMVVLVAIVTLIAALKIGISSNFFASQIQGTLNAKLGGRANIDISNTYLLLDENFHLSLESRDVALELKTVKAQISKIGRIRIAIAAKALLQGELHVAQVQVSDVDVRLPGGQGGNFLERLPKDGAGRVDFNALSNLIFTLFNQGMEGFSRQNLNEITIERVRLSFPFRGKDKQLELIKLALEHKNTAAHLAGMAQFDGQEVQIEGQAQYDSVTGNDHFQVHLKYVPLYLGSAEEHAPYWEDGTVKNSHFRLKGISDIQFSGSRKGADQEIWLAAHLPEGTVELADVSDLPARATLNLHHKLGQAGIFMTNTQLAVDRVRVDLHGSFAPLDMIDPFSASGPQDLLSDAEIIARLASIGDVEGKYGFELSVDKGSVSHPSLPDLHFSAATNGTLETLSRKVIFNAFTLLADDVDISGQGSLRFSPPDQGQLFIGSQSPEVIFNLYVPTMDANDIKQLWLFNIASASRRWFLQQVEAGKLLSGQIMLNLPLDFYQKGKPRHPLSGNELKISGGLNLAKVKLVGDLPALENFEASFDIQGQEVALRQGKAQAFLDKKNFAQSYLSLKDIAVDIIRSNDKASLADIRFQIKGEGAEMLRLIGRDPIKAGEKLPFTAADFSGQLQAVMHLRFPLIELGQKLLPDQIDWSGQIDFDNVALTLALETGGEITQAQGQVMINQHNFTLAAQAKLDGMEATVEMAGATQEAQSRDEKITLILDDETRDRLLPSLAPFISGQSHIEIGAERMGGRSFDIDLQQALVEVPWLGWKKGVGIAAKAQFTAYVDKKNSKNIQLKNFSLKGESFQLSGEVDILDGHLAAARFGKASFNRGDNLTLDVQFANGRYLVKVNGKKFDMRSFIKSANLTGSGNVARNEAVTLALDIGRVSGFHGENFDNFKASFKRNQDGSEEVSLSANSLKGLPLSVRLNRQNKKGALRVKSGDAGTLLRFVDYYDKLQGGVLDLELQLDESGTWYGPSNLYNFEIVNEPRLARIVASSPPSGGKSLNDATGGKINTSRLSFERAFVQIERGENFLMLDRGIVRGSSVGATFQGIVYDSAGNVSMTGTFMPAYGLNRIFSNVPLLGNILGNGRDRGLIGITFKIDGKAKNPRIIVNPLSIIAPGVFRQIFEFH